MHPSPSTPRNARATRRLPTALVGSLAIGALALVGCSDDDEDVDEALDETIDGEPMVDDAGTADDVDVDDGDDAAVDTDAGVSEVVTGTAAVDIADFAYSPERIEVAAGDEITWTNLDDFAHTVTASDGDAFDSGNIDGEGTYSLTLDEPGTYAYFCTIHTQMTGEIVVG